MYSALWASYTVYYLPQFGEVAITQLVPSWNVETHPQFERRWLEAGETETSTSAAKATIRGVAALTGAGDVTVLTS